jgi:hypothetical protein
MELGPAVYTQIRNEPISKKNRFSDLKSVVDQDPARLIEGELLARILVERAVSCLPPPPETEWAYAPPTTPAMESFKRILEQDGFTVTDGALRRVLPTDIGLPETESELMRLLEAYQLSTAKGHLKQALDIHARGDWAGANGQIRTFFDSLTDSIAERIDPNTATLASGHVRRAKLASLGFFSLSLNEWDNDGKGYINGLVKRLHPEGAHPGLSDEDDSTFRLHTVLLTATLLMRRFHKGSSR